MANTQAEAVDLASFHQLVHEFIGGSVRRHKFTPQELEFLLDLQACGIRKSAQPDLLRRYLKVVQQSAGDGSRLPMRLSVFIETNGRRRASKAKASAGETSGLS